MISVAAELAHMHPQTLRMYEARGLIAPQRSPKNTRLYSQRDVELPAADPRADRRRPEPGGGRESPGAGTAPGRARDAPGENGRGVSDAT